MLQMLGINPERVEFYNLSAAQGPRWAEICTEFTKKINADGTITHMVCSAQEKRTRGNRKAARLTK